MDQILWEAISEFEKAFGRCRKNIMQRFNLSAIEVDVLIFLTNFPQYTTATEIAANTNLKKSHISLAVGKLLYKGYLTRKADETNHKRLHLQLTENAAEIAHIGRTQLALLTKALFLNFSEKEQNFFDQMCARIITNIRATYESF